MRAPLSRTRGSVARPFPPIAATGNGVASTTTRTPLTPIGPPASAFEPVAKIGPAPT